MRTQGRGTCKSETPRRIKNSRRLGTGATPARRLDHRATVAVFGVSGLPNQYKQTQHSTIQSSLSLSPTTSLIRFLCYKLATLQAPDVRERDFNSVQCTDIISMCTDVVRSHPVPFFLTPSSLSMNI